MTDTLAAVWTHAWARLLAGARDRSDPFRQGVLATVGPEGPQARYAVLRAVDPAGATVAFHTDRRSPKLAQLGDDARLAWCFMGHQEQLRLAGVARLHLDDAEADAAWQACSRAARRTYAVRLPPGTPLGQSDACGDAVGEQTSDVALAGARANFALVRVHLHGLDWLSLAASGHRRAAFERGEDGWQPGWRSP